MYNGLVYNQLVYNQLIHVNLFIQVNFEEDMDFQLFNSAVLNLGAVMRGTQYILNIQEAPGPVHWLHVNNS